MTSNEVIGTIGSVVFAAFIFLCLRTTARWGAETKKREEEYLKAQEVTTPDETGTMITIVRDTSQEPTTYAPNQPRPCSCGSNGATACRSTAV